jgi:hypothetical protein
MVGISVAFLAMPEGTAVLTISKPTLPNRPDRFVTLCYRDIERRNRMLADPKLARWFLEAKARGTSPKEGLTAMDFVDLALNPDEFFGMGERCLALAGIAASAGPVRLPEQPPPQWLQEEARHERRWLLEKWQYRAVWIGLPFLGMIAGSSCALIAWRRIVHAFSGSRVPIGLGWRGIVVGVLFLILFMWFVWPTPYLYIPGPKGVPLRVNRLTGEVRYIQISPER